MDVAAARNIDAKMNGSVAYALESYSSSNPILRNMKSQANIRNF